MKKWEYLLESDERARRLRTKAISTGDEKDWGNYEDYLIRHGDMTKAFASIVARVSLSRVDLIKRLIDRVEGAPDNQVVMMTARLTPWRGETTQVGIPSESTPRTYLLLGVSGNIFRVRSQRQTGLRGTTWSPIFSLKRSEVQSASFNVVILRPEDMPRTPH